ncbi:hypothetical protein Tco_1296456, partial [Tanacetum coccineum]
RTVSKVPYTEDTIKFMLDTEEFTYYVVMLRVTLTLPVGWLARNVLVRGMVIPDEFLTEEIRATNDFKEYETVFAGVDVLMNQLQPVVSTQGTHRSTPRAYRTPTISTASPQGKKKKIVRESSSPRKPHKITIRKKKQSTTPIPLPGDDRERDEVAEATILSLTLYKTTLAAEAQENIAKVQEKLDEEEIEKMVKGKEDEESYASEFFDSMINDDVDDSGTRIEPGSHKEHLENVNDDDEEIEKEMKDHEIEKEEKKDDVEKTDECVLMGLTATVSPTTTTTSKDSSTSKHQKNSISYKTKILPGSIAGMCRRRGQNRTIENDQQGDATSD